MGVTGFGSLTEKVLQNCPYPIVLHVKHDISSRGYDHYELFLGAKEDKILLFDPPEPIEPVAFADLAPRLDGKGLILSTQPIDLSSVFAPARKQFAMYAGIVVAVIMSLRLARRWLPETMLNCRRRLLALSVGQVAVLGITALFCGTIYHFANDEGLLANVTAVEGVQKAHAGNFIPKLTLG